MKKLYSLLLVVFLTVGVLAGCVEKKDQVKEEIKPALRRKQRKRHILLQLKML